MIPKLDSSSWFLVVAFFWMSVFALKVYIDVEVDRAVRQEIQYLMRAAK